MYGNKVSILVNKVKGQVKSINLIKHAFREVVDKKIMFFNRKIKIIFIELKINYLLMNKLKSQFLWRTYF